MKKYIILVILLSCSIINARLSIDKSFILLDNDKRNDTLQIFNSSSETKYYKIEFIHQKQTESGGYTKIAKKDSKNNADEILIISPKRIIIQPKSSQTVRFQRKNLNNVNNGDYISFVLIQELEDPNKTAVNVESNVKKSKELSISITPLFGVSFPVIIRKGETSFNLNVLSLNPAIVNNKPALSLYVEHKGMHSSRGSFKLTYKGKLIAIASDVNIFASTPQRQVALAIADEDVYAEAKQNKDFIKLEYIDSIDKKFNFTQNISIAK